MKFTKILALVLAMLMLFALVSCGDTNADAKDTDNKAADTANDTVADTADDVADADNVLVMATNAFFPPYEFYEGETIVGIDAEIAAKIAEKLGMTLKIEDMEFNSITTAVQEGSVDFGMAGMTITEDRLLEVDFSISYANGVQVIIVKEDSPITCVDDLYAEGASYKVGVQLGTTGDTYSTDDFGADNVTQYATGNEAVLALAGGDVDCVIIDNEPAKAYVAANAGLKILETTYADEDYAICVQKGNTELLQKIDAAILELTEDGTIDSIVSQYIGE
ncbi:MAG: transporter substrate-binding domain-containing protein [Ruminococcaceae bacterium]|nr:transporter substrate-binding domain-containing protein [Oscillospiraceae bacterium]